MSTTSTTLTKRQKQILRFVAKRIVNLEPPTYREISGHFGLASTNGITVAMKSLQRKGYVKLIPNKSRGIRLTEQGLEFYRGT